MRAGVAQTMYWMMLQRASAHKEKETDDAKTTILSSSKKVVLKSAALKRRPIKRFVENQCPDIGPCKLVRVPTDLCRKSRTPAGSR